MTPEGLDQAIRQDPVELLERFGMFVFDEVHLIKEKSRGFKLESVLSFLHWRTRDTAHKIVLLSAAMGNSGQLASWVQVDSDPTLLSSEWRGPRRLNAIYNSEIDWTVSEVSDVPGARGSSKHLVKRLTFRSTAR